MSKVVIDRAVVEQAMKAMLNFPGDISDEMFESIRALKAALAEPAQEPAALDWLRMWANQDGVEPETQWHDGYEAARRVVQLHLGTPPQRKPLTEKEMYAVEEEARKNFRLSQKGPRGQQITYWDGLTPWLIRAVERAHGIKE